jgi:hypothetical protein
VTKRGVSPRAGTVCARRMSTVTSWPPGTALAVGENAL